MGSKKTLVVFVSFLTFLAKTVLAESTALCKLCDSRDQLLCMTNGIKYREVYDSRLYVSFTLPDTDNIWDQYHYKQFLACT